MLQTKCNCLLSTRLQSRGVPACQTLKWRHSRVLCRVTSATSVTSPTTVAAHADEASKQQPAASGPAVYYAEPSGPALTQEQQEKLWSAPASTFRLNNEVLRGNNQEDLAFLSRNLGSRVLVRLMFSFPLHGEDSAVMEAGRKVAAAVSARLLSMRQGGKGQAWLLTKRPGDASELIAAAEAEGTAQKPSKRRSRDTGSPALPQKPAQQPAVSAAASPATAAAAAPVAADSAPEVASAPSTSSSPPSAPSPPSQPSEPSSATLLEALQAALEAAEGAQAAIREARAAEARAQFQVAQARKAAGRAEHLANYELPKVLGPKRAGSPSNTQQWASYGSHNFTIKELSTLASARGVTITVANSKPGAGAGPDVAGCSSRLQKALEQHSIVGMTVAEGWEQLGEVVEKAGGEVLACRGAPSNRQVVLITSQGRSRSEVLQLAEQAAQKAAAEREQKESSATAKWAAHAALVAEQQAAAARRKAERQAKHQARLSASPARQLAETAGSTAGTQKG